MDEKKEKCKRCGVKIEPKTKRAEFCSPKCKVYWHREHPKVNLKNFNKPTNSVKPITEKKETSNFVVNTRPKNLMELKAMCPFPENSDERRLFIATERQKYGI